MMKFFLKAGRHYPGNGETGYYEQGDVVESHDDLEKRFREKFERVADNIRVSPIRAATMMAPTPVVSQDQQQNPKTIAARPNPNKLVATDSEPTGAQDSPMARVTGKYTENRVSRLPKLNAPIAGKDVTENYPDAAENDFRVTKSQGLYHLVDAETGRPVNVKGVDRSGLRKMIREAVRVGA